MDPDGMHLCNDDVPLHQTRMGFFRVPWHPRNRGGRAPLLQDMGRRESSHQIPENPWNWHS